MSNMRAALAKELKAIHADKASDAQYEALATKLTGEVAYVVQNCKLDPKADAELHKQGVARRDGAVRVVKALNAYGKYFDHRGWRNL